MLTSQDELQKASKEEIAMILSSIYQWRDAWKFSNFNEYISFYSEDFKKEDGTKFKKFYKYKKRIFRKREKKRISLENINITPYPNSLNKRIYKVIMDEKYRSPTVKFVGQKELYFEIKNNEAKIIVEG